MGCSEEEEEPDDFVTRGLPGEIVHASNGVYTSNA